MKLKNTIKNTIKIFTLPYLTFLIIMFFVISILFLGVEELWEEYTSKDGIGETNYNDNSNGGGKLIWPLPGYSRISSKFGNRLHPIRKVISFHDGIDIPAPKNTKVISPTNGIVVNTYNSKSVGNTVEIKNDLYKFVFHHLNFISVNKGQAIEKGNQIGGVGTTGTLSTGNHLHFTVYKNDKKINPLKVVDFN